MNRRLPLLKKLDQFAPSTPALKVQKERIAALLAKEGDVFSRAHFEPGHLTASAFITRRNDQEMFLIFHKKLQLWLQPGGHIESGDASIFAAATRELHEEVGAFDALSDGSLFDIDIHEIPAHKNEPAHFHYDLRFLFREQNDAPKATEEVADGRYFSCADLAQNADDASVKRVAQMLSGRSS